MSPWSATVMTAVSPWMEEVKALVDERLQAYFAEQLRRAKEIAPEAPELVEAIATLTMRGGKRLRPAVLVAAFRAVDPSRSPRDVVDAGAALELLQSYLLIHDDWMDDDEERRGGPSVHAALRDLHGGDVRLGSALAVLAGDLACAQAWELLALGGDWPPQRRQRAIAAFLAMQQEVVLGQQLDLLGTADVSRMQQLKTGSYTVRGPLDVGAALAGANAAQHAALQSYGAPLGEAFQLRDDLLGTFGDPRQTGKPTGSDLRSGKRNALVRAAEELLSPADRAPLTRVLEGEARDDVAIEKARDLLAESGARARVEAKLQTLLSQAGAALESAPLHAPGTSMLRELADRLALRDR